MQTLIKVVNAQTVPDDAIAAVDEATHWVKSGYATPAIQWLRCLAPKMFGGKTWVEHVPASYVRLGDWRVIYLKQRDRPIGEEQPKILRHLVVFLAAGLRPRAVQVADWWQLTGGETHTELLDAAVLARVIIPNQGGKGRPMLAARQHPAYELVIQEPEHAGVVLYKRKLADMDVDYVGIAGDHVAHDESAFCASLRAKDKAAGIAR